MPRGSSRTKAWRETQIRGREGETDLRQRGRNRLETGREQQSKRQGGNSSIEAEKE
jgi:hypothetical protein